MQIFCTYGNACTHTTQHSRRRTTWTIRPRSVGRWDFADCFPSIRRPTSNSLSVVVVVDGHTTRVRLFFRLWHTCCVFAQFRLTKHITQIRQRRICMQPAKQTAAQKRPPNRTLRQRPLECRPARRHWAVLIYIGSGTSEADTNRTNHVERSAHILQTFQSRAYVICN